MTCTSSRQKDVRGLWQSQHLPHYTRETEMSYHPWKCGAASASLVSRRRSSEEDFVCLVMLQDLPAVGWSRTYFSQHHIVHGTGEVEASYRRGQPRPRQTWEPSPDRESSATHDGLFIPDFRKHTEQPRRMKSATIFFILCNTMLFKRTWINNFTSQMFEIFWASTHLKMAQHLPYSR